MWFIKAWKLIKYANALHDHKNQIEELSLYLLGTVGLFALMDRLVMGAFQRRSGPYSIGWFGLLQPIVDGIKLIKKESIIVQK